MVVMMPVDGLGTLLKLAKGLLGAGKIAGLQGTGQAFEIIQAGIVRIAGIRIQRMGESRIVLLQLGKRLLGGAEIARLEGGSERLKIGAGLFETGQRIGGIDATAGRNGGNGHGFCAVGGSDCRRPGAPPH